MRSLPLIRSQDTRYRQESAFSYTCHACSRCCYDKIIHVNPYEIARLAENRGISTTEFISRYADANGTVLKQADDGACVFLTSEGCGVHPDRPLVCRLYPLGRRLTAEGEETFHELTPHPQTEGEYGTSGTVGEFLSRQGAAPFIEAVDRYVEVVGRMAAVLIARTSTDRQLQEDVRDAVDDLFRGADRDVPDWLDMDRVVGRYCAQQELIMPTDVQGKMTLHIQAIETWLRDT